MQCDNGPRTNNEAAALIRLVPGAAAQAVHVPLRIEFHRDAEAQGTCRWRSSSLPVFGSGREAAVSCHVLLMLCENKISAV